MSNVVGHHATRVLAALIAALPVWALLPVEPRPTAAPALAVLLPVAAGLGWAILRHQRRLCERCVRAMPLDASAVAARYGRRFRVAHLFERRLVAVGYLAAVLVCSLLYASPVGRVAWAVAVLSLVYLLFVQLTHQRLQPWCPHCRHGGVAEVTPTAPTPILTNA
ncbi:hypothetical protein GCM10010123_07290 [Pilimelia anulata]|uniref:Uncharacterized protein n=1 Tax=Pilimelia anulata TaxID=53371 RepID=A0A8J3B090_9ACTN|nr:hypothetical protein [Pilimelia anulata]GGJ79978.1 hypothetical protein GCM10010123_07290 [Pilimelia anulata]